MNDLNRTDGITSIGDLDSKQLEEEKNRLLTEAAAELREENTRQEKILEVAKRLAILKGQDPEQGTQDCSEEQRLISLEEVNLYLLTD